MSLADFSGVPRARWVAENALAFAVRDGFPVSEGHTLVITKRVVPTWFDATDDERRALMDLVDGVRAQLDAEFHPDGYNVGFNAGPAAGQTVMHLHVHVIPRYRGDMDDPRGGVRHVIPARGNYLAGAALEPQSSAAPAFLEKLLTLLDQAQFTATYKFAVLLALVDLCIEHGSAQGVAPGSVTTTQLAEKVIARYWPQTAPFGEAAAVLRQNAGAPQGARILTQIARFRSEHTADPTTSLLRAQIAAPVAFEALLREVEWTLVSMPLPRVQLLPGGAEDRFLYDIAWSVAAPLTRGAVLRRDFDNVIRFRPGAAESLIALASVIRPMVQRRWAAKVARLNQQLVDDARLEEFLFGTPRRSLVAVRDPLIELHGGRCFYCAGALGREVEVDHFIAWSRHPENAIENLVPAHPRCNASKSDHFAASEHLARWVGRIRLQDKHLDAIAEHARWDRAPRRAITVARVLYLRLRDDVKLWRACDAFEPAARDALVRALAG